MLIQENARKILRRYSPKKEDIEEQVFDLFKNVDLDELLFNGNLAKIPPKVEVDQIVVGKVILIRNNYALIDFGHKTEGILPYREDDSFSNEDIDIDDELNLLVKSVSKDGTVYLSRKNVDLIAQQRKIINELEEGQRIEGKLIQHTKIGWIVDFNGYPATLPNSQEYILYPPGKTPEDLVDTYIIVDIESINDGYVTLTRQAFANEFRRKAKESYLDNLSEDDIVEGTVKNVTDFGVFIQIGGGIIGLCHDSDKGDTTPETGQKIKSRVLKIDREKNRVSLGIRQVSEPSWNELIKKYHVDDRVVGKVTSLVTYGAFMEIESGINGLIHVSDLSWSVHVKHPKEILNEGDEIEVIILGIDKEKKHLSLGLKQITSDPWETISDRYLVGSTTQGKITNKVKFGIFVELEKGVEGLAHHTVNSKELKPGDEVDVTVLRVDTARKKIALALD